MIEPEHAARLGMAERFRPGDRAHVERIVARLQGLGIRHLRTELSWAEYRDGQEWHDWLLARLGGAFALLPSLRCAPAPGPPRRVQDFADFVDAVVDRHGQAFEAVELWSEPGRLDWDSGEDPGCPWPCDMLAAAARQARSRGKRAVLGGAGAADMGWLRLMGQRGVLDAVDAVGVQGFHDAEGATPWRGWAALLDDVRRTVAPFNPALAAWITGAGHSTWRHDAANQARAFLEALRAPAERVYWHGVQDLDPFASAPQALRPSQRDCHFGIDDAEGAPKLLGRLLAGGVAAVERIVALPCPAVGGIRPVLVTGGAGFIGANLADRLAREGSDVLVYDALARPGVERNLGWLVARHPARVSVAVADIRDEHAMADAAAQAEAVFHLAAQVAVTTSLVRPAQDFDINLRATLHLLEALRRRNPDAPLLFASTNKVYGDLADVALERRGEQWLPEDPALRSRGVGEARPLCFHTPYGCSKGAADQYVLDYAHSFGLRTAVLRMSCIYGERQLGTEDQGWVAHFLLRALAGQKLTIYGDGRQVRDVLHIDDAVGAYVAAWRNIDAIAGRAFNLGGGPVNAISLRQLIAHIEALVGRGIDLDFQAWRAGDQRYFVADASAARAALALPAPLGWRAGIARLAAHFGAPHLAEAAQ